MQITSESAQHRFRCGRCRWEGRTNWTRCCQPLATVATFFLSCPLTKSRRYRSKQLVARIYVIRKYYEHLSGIFDYYQTAYVLWFQQIFNLHTISVRYKFLCQAYIYGSLLVPGFSRRACPKRLLAKLGEMHLLGQAKGDLLDPHQSLGSDHISCIQRRKTIHEPQQCDLEWISYVPE